MPVSGVYIFAIVFSFSLLLQLEIFFRFFNSTQKLYDVVSLLASQWENLAFSISLGCFWLVAHDIKILRQLLLIIIAAYIVYLPFDFGFFATFFQHFQFGLIEGQETSLIRLKDSLIAEISLWTLTNFLSAFLIVFYLYKKTKNSDLVSFKKPGVRIACLLVVTYLLTSFVISRASSKELSQNPAVTILLSRYLNPNKANPKFIPITTEDIDSLRFGRINEASYKPPLPAGTFNNHNVVYIILESVGSLQALDESGKFKPEFFKGISKYADRTIIYPDVTNLFPSTVRSHVPLSTGGRNITYGSVYHEYTFPYAGPTLAGRLKDLGYATALYSAAYMEVENLGVVYKQLPYDERFYPEEQSPQFREKFQINSWGVDEREIVNLANAWSKSKSKYFLHFLTSSTHHPYSVPSDYTASTKDKIARYHESISFVDTAVTDLIKKLDDGRTVFFITGDHGQAFGERHSTNFTHKNYIYEENIRNFFAVILPRPADQQPISKPNLFIGDVAPSIIDFIGGKTDDFLGASILSPQYHEKIRYFYKSAPPDLWGLRDGRWKFISRINGSSQAELYDLEDDPYEQNNLANHHQDRIKDYFRLCQQWFVRSERDFKNHLIGYFPKDENSAAGPKTIFFGVKNDKGDFKEKVSFSKSDRVVASTRNIPFQKNTPLTYLWIGPNGERDQYNFLIKAGWVKVDAYKRPELELSDGIWKVQIRLKDRILLEGTFYVKE